MNDISKERRVIKSDLVPSTPPMSEAQRDFNKQPKSQAIKQPPGAKGGPYGGSNDSPRDD